LIADRFYPWFSGATEASAAMKDRPGSPALIAVLLLSALMLSALIGCQSSSVEDSRPSVSSVATERPRYDLTEPNAMPAKLVVSLARREPYLLAASRIEGRDTGLFLVDTGSALNAVSTGLANQLDLPEGEEGTAIGIGGRATYHRRRVEWWGLEGIALPGDHLAALQLHRLNQAAPFQTNGVLGYLALRHVPFTLDHAQAELILHNPDDFRPPEGARRVELLTHRFLPAVEATLSNGQRVKLILDSGADNAITLPRSVLKRWPEVAAVPETGSGRSRGIGGTIESTNTWLKDLQIFGLTLRHLPVAFESSGPGMQRGELPVGRVGLELLKHCRLTFDPANNTLWVEWRPEQNKNRSDSSSRP